MIFDINKNVVKKVVETMGNTSLVIAMEECSELSQALSKVFRGKLDRENLKEEMADVLICIDEIMYKENISQDDIQKWIDYKLERADGKMKNGDLI